MFKFDMGDTNVEGDAGDADVDKDSAPETDEDDGSEATVINHRVDSHQHTHSRALERDAAKASCKPHLQFHSLETQLSDEESLCGSDVDDLVNWVRAKPVLEKMQRRRSEGKGRLRAKERAEDARMRWTKGAD